MKKDLLCICEWITMYDGQDLIFKVHIEPIGAVNEVWVKLVKIPKSHYSKLVKNKKIGNQVWFKEPYDRKAYPYKFGGKND